MATIYFKEGENKEMLKKVNIYPQAGPITSVNPTIRTAVRGAIKSISDIKKCLMARAKVEEILSDGSLKQLTLYNYADNLEPQSEEITAEEPVVETPAPAVVEEQSKPEPEVTIVNISTDPKEEDEGSIEEAPEEESDEPDVDTLDLEEL